MKSISFYDAKLKWETDTIGPYLKHCNYNLSAVAPMLGLNRTTLVQILQRWVRLNAPFDGMDTLKSRYDECVRKQVVRRQGEKARAAMSGAV